jgi:hypothetical protein
LYRDLNGSASSVRPQFGFARRAVTHGSRGRQTTESLTIPGSAFMVRVASDDILKLAPDYQEHMPKPLKTGPITPFDEAQW